MVRENDGARVRKRPNASRVLSPAERSWEIAG